MQRALKISEKALEEDHPDVAGSLNNLGHTHHAQGQPDKAIECHERALEIWKNALGERPSQCRNPP